MGRITAMLLVRNEANRYLRLCLDYLSLVATEIIILDDASDDETVAVCRSYEKVTRLFSNPAPLFWQDESLLRRRLWQLTIETNPEWILAVDADEVLDNRFEEYLGWVTAGSHHRVSFQLYEFWGSMAYYRTDGYWNPVGRYYSILMRYDPSISYVWKPHRLHCGRLPVNVDELPGLQTNLVIKHYGWANPADHLAKYRRYIANDPTGVFTPLSHYQSILDPNPQLAAWHEPEGPPKILPVPGSPVIPLPTSGTGYAERKPAGYWTIRPVSRRQTGSGIVLTGGIISTKLPQPLQVQHGNPPALHGDDPLPG